MESLDIQNTVLEEAYGLQKDGSWFDNYGGDGVNAIKIDGLKNPSGHWADVAKAVRAFKKDPKTKRATIDVKRKKYAPQVKKWLSERKPTQWYCDAKASGAYRDDSIDIWYQTEGSLSESEDAQTPKKTLREFKEYLGMLEEQALKFGGQVNPKFGQIVFLVGGAGSGKGKIGTDMVALDKKVLDVDELKKDICQKGWLNDTIRKTYGKAVAELGLDMDAFLNKMANLKDTTLVSKLHALVKEMNLDKKVKGNIVRLRDDIDNARLPNILFDVTFKDLKKGLRDVEKCLSIGYKPENIHVVWVLNSVENARVNNASRARTVSDDILVDTAIGSAKTMKALMSSPEIQTKMNGDWYVVFNLWNDKLKKNTDIRMKGIETTVNAKGFTSAWLKDAEKKRLIIADYCHLKKRGNPTNIGMIDADVIERIKSTVHNGAWDDEQNAMLESEETEGEVLQEFTIRNFSNVPPQPWNGKIKVVKDISIETLDVFRQKYIELCDKWIKPVVGEFESILKRCGKVGNNIKVLGPQIKGEDSMWKKCTVRGKDIGKITDVMRGAILVNKPEEVEEVIQVLGKAGKIVELEQKERGSGGFGYYGPTHLLLQLKNGVSVEIQVMPRKMWTYKEWGHGFYEKYRELLASGKEIADKAQFTKDMRASQAVFDRGARANVKPNAR